MSNLWKNDNDDNKSGGSYTCQEDVVSGIFSSNILNFNIRYTSY